MDETAMMKLADVIHILEFIVPDDRWLSNLPVQRRGRNASYPAPPAQIPA